MFDFDFQGHYKGHGDGMHFFELSDLENVILNIKIIILAHIIPEILKHIEIKVRDLEYEGHVLRSRCQHAFF